MCKWSEWEISYINRERKVIKDTDILKITTALSVDANELFKKGDERVEISEKEYFELKEQVRELQRKVDGINNPPKDLRSRVMETPISDVRNIEEGVPVFDYRHFPGNDAWVVFVRLAKLIHKPSDRFYMDSAYSYGEYKPYIRSYRCGDTPKKLTDMSEEQVQISIDMLNEMIPIYNKYFKKTHETVLYSENKDGIYKPVNVFRVEEE